jgi:hypothetical protein
MSGVGGPPPRPVRGDLLSTMGQGLGRSGPSPRETARLAALPMAQNTATGRWLRVGTWLWICPDHSTGVSCPIGLGVEVR